MRRQPKVDGGRAQLPSCVVHEIREAVTFMSHEYGVSRSWVVAVLLGDALGIATPGYDMIAQPRKRKAQRARRGRA